MKIFLLLIINLCFACNQNEIEYYVDNNPNNKTVYLLLKKVWRVLLLLFLIIGIPGLLGVDDPNKLCLINEYCNETGNCTNIKLHPLFNQDCPYEKTIIDPSSVDFCGGLHCYQHKCLLCIEGMKDFVDGKICYQSEWFLFI
jgi:hypothetical protein